MGHTLESAMQRVEADHLFPRDRAHYHGQRFRQLLEWTGVLERLSSRPLVVVAGSCGKGSTARFLGSILKAMGHRVGLATKPPVDESPRGNLERYQVLPFGWMPAEVFASLVDEIEPYLQRLAQECPHLGAVAPFDIRYWILARWFCDMDVSVAIFEANIGLLQDVVSALPTPTLQLLTPLADDHAAWLLPPDPLPEALQGVRVPGVVWHKVAGLWPGVPVVVSPQEPANLQAIEMLAQGPLYVQGRDFRVVQMAETAGGSEVEMKLMGHAVQTRLHVLGGYQGENLASAAAAAMLLHPGRENEVLQAVQSAAPRTRIPGRMEVIDRNPTTIANAASSGAKMESFMESVHEWLSKVAPEARVDICVTYTRRVQRLEESLHNLVRWERVRRVYATASPRTGDQEDVPPQQLAAMVRAVRPEVACTVVPEARAALDQARSAAAPSDVVLVVGGGICSVVYSR